MWGFFYLQHMIQTSKGNDQLLIRKLARLEKEVGHTPLVRLRKLFSKKNVQVWAKQEWKQLSGSVKCRPAFRIIKEALRMDALKPGMTLLDATSGNTGIAYAAIGKRLGIPVTLCLPENASQDRKKILQSLGAELILTSRFEGTDGAQVRAKELAWLSPNKYFYADQYRNEHNWKSHYLGTAVEIWNELPRVTHFVAGLGTTGTFTGTGRRLKVFNPAIQLVSLQPDTALHGMEGWKHLETARVPGIYDPGLADNHLEISTEEAYQLIKDVLKYEGWMLSPSAAANLAGAIRVAEQLDRGTVVTMLPDNADKYSEVIRKIF